MSTAFHKAARQHPPVCCHSGREAPIQLMIRVVKITAQHLETFATAWLCGSPSCSWSGTCHSVRWPLVFVFHEHELKGQRPCRKVDVAHVIMMGTAGSEPRQPEHGDGCTSNTAGSSTARIGHYPTASAVHGCCGHSQAGSSASLPGAELAVVVLHPAVQKHSLVSNAEQDCPARGL